MNKRHYLTLILISITLTTNAQASGGQIRRNNKSSKTERIQTPKRGINQDSRKKNERIVKKTLDVTSSQNDFQPIPLDRLATYNVVAFSTKSIENACDECRDLRNEGYSSQIYKDPNMGNYLIILKSTDNESEALSFLNRIKKDYSKAWILYIVDGIQEIYYK